MRNFKITLQKAKVRTTCITAHKHTHTHTHTHKNSQKNTHLQTHTRQAYKINTGKVETAWKMLERYGKAVDTKMKGCCDGLFCVCVCVCVGEEEEEEERIDEKYD